MKAVETLPEGYNVILSIDLQKDNKLALLVNGIALLISAIMVVPACFMVPITTLFNMGDGMSFWVKIVVLLVGIIAYMVLHELVHGIAMKMCGTKKVKYGFTGLYAFAGSSDYYDKKSYIFIALAPVVLWGVVLLIINLMVPLSWFWVVYIIQVCNISGAGGDLYVTFKFSKLPKDILITDKGVGMTVYSKTTVIKPEMVKSDNNKSVE